MNGNNSFYWIFLFPFQEEIEANRKAIFQAFYCSNWARSKSNYARCCLLTRSKETAKQPFRSILVDSVEVSVNRGVKSFLWKSERRKILSWNRKILLKSISSNKILLFEKKLISFNLSDSEKVLRLSSFCNQATEKRINICHGNHIFFNCLVTHKSQELIEQKPTQIWKI